ncbi:sugar ABC transporter ATP-binding protein [Faecalicatena orotica]|uniref:Monosaccharide ABC transporter ATP-binding protein (CUT2 family) n=1 Tax=Faecalicatena orotica TaxID=1544 RepID=A0A2Y9B8S5_9FIRM|nr:monosaccharide ABC transporter ATP-binding protein (CUT2 family) [Faecalicatena orotica]SSA54257.1 monosaccharide ABC transporter ATP-binding protein, CUT2 family [Faecalicatena orotica]
MNEDYILQMKGINKSFGGVQVLYDLDFSMHAGEVRALAGENGAGKSTLMKILGGIYDCDSGEVLIDGEKTSIGSVEDAQKRGVSIIHQEIVLVQDMTVGENIFLGREFKTRMGFIDYQKIYREAAEILGRIGLESLRPDTIVRELSISQQQMVEIAKALSTNSRILVMDEPTSSLTDREVEFLFEQIKTLSRKGVSIIYISHKMEEINQIADSITIMRDGHHILTTSIRDISYEQIIQNMVGHKIEDYYPDYKVRLGKEILRVEHLTTEKVEDISFSLAEGEILGITGLMGAGRTELAKAVFGLDEILSGSLYIDGKKCTIKSPGEAIRKKIALVPEDRKENGLFLENSISFNMTVTVMDEFIKGISVDAKKEKQILEEYISQLEIKMAGTEQLAVELSGGNQQKIVISKWLASNPKILILDEPTRGVDVGAKSDIYHLICKIAETGVAIILISSELPEVMNMSSRIGVMCEGKLVRFFEPDKEEVTQEQIMHYATGGYEHETYNG